MFPEVYIYEKDCVKNIKQKKKVRSLEVYIIWLWFNSFCNIFPIQMKLIIYFDGIEGQTEFPEILKKEWRKCIAPDGEFAIG